MNLIQKTPAQQTAEQIDREQVELLGHIESRLHQWKQRASSQAVLDAFGPAAVTALTKYATLQAAVAALNPNTSVAAPDPEVFQAQPDGTVIYSPPAPPTPGVGPTL